MICASCQKAPAVVLIKTIVKNRVAQRALCQACASEAGAGAPDPVDLMLQWLSGHPASRPRVAPPACPCGMRFAQFQETGRLGCPRCYERFGPQLGALLPRLHRGAGKHRGKAPRGR